MKKNTHNALIVFLLGFLPYSLFAQTFFYEDFRYDAGNNGFTVQHVALGGQTAAEVGKRIADIPDANDSDPVFDENSRPTNRIPQGGLRAQRAISFKNTSGSSPNFTNHAIEAWAMMTTQDLSNKNAPKVSFWTQQRYVKGGGAALSIWVSEDYTEGDAPSTATWTDETANITGSITTSDEAPQTYVSGELDLSNYSSSTVTVAFKVVTDNTPYDADNAHGTFYISDVRFDVTPQDVADGVIDSNVSATNQSSVFISPYASIDEDNFSNTSVWGNIFSTENSVPRLEVNTLIPINEGYQFEVSDVYNPILVTEMTYLFANGASNKGAPDESEWIVQGSNDNSNWDNLSDSFGMFTSNSAPNTGTISLTTSQPYRYYRFVLAKAWTPNSTFTALQKLDFTVDSQALSVKETSLDTSFTIFPNPSNSKIHINVNASDVEVQNVSLISFGGKEVYQNSNSNPIDVSSFAKGLYILKIVSNEGIVTHKKVMIK